ncbi:MAG TPA: NAD(P)H:quinone oxidoreductase [Chthonomonadaceae bacterium]|nr:NAD(P)H:quinone oxidoreductase [Chthonomonadaceae bacterium]
MSQPVKVMIVFYSRNGCTAALAEAIAEGALEAGAEVTLRRVDEFLSEEIINTVPGWKESREILKGKYQPPTVEEAEHADAIVFGTPTRFGAISSELKSYIDSLGSLWGRGALNGKVGSAFTTTASPHGGNEATILSLYPPMAHLGFIIVPTGYTDPVFFSAGTPYGASAVSGQNNAPPTEQDLAGARAQGRRVAQVAAALKQAG